MISLQGVALGTFGNIVMLYEHGHGVFLDVACCFWRRRNEASPYWIPEPILSGSNSPERV